MSVSSGSDVTIPMEDSPPPPPSPFRGKSAKNVGIENAGFQDGGSGDDAKKRLSSTKTQTEIPMNEYSSDDRGNGQRVNEAVNTELVNGMNVLDTIPHKPQSEFGPYEKFPEYFISVNQQHKKFLRRGEKLSVTKDKRNTSGKWRKYLCWTLGGFLVAAIIAVAVLAAVGAIPPGRSSTGMFGMQEMTTRVPPDYSSSTTSSYESTESIQSTTSSNEEMDKSSTEKTTTSPVSDNYVPNAADLELTLNEEYPDELNDPTSEKYQRLVNELERQVKLKLESHSEVDMANAHVTGFTSGSIIAKFRIVWSRSQLGDETPDFDKIQRFVSSWKEIGNYTLQTGTTRIYKLYNTCKISNGGCSDSCVFDEIELTFVCVCPEDKKLDKNDNKTCISEPAQSTTEESLSPPVTSESPESIPSEEPIIIHEIHSTTTTTTTLPPQPEEPITEADIHTTTTTTTIAPQPPPEEPITVAEIQNTTTTTTPQSIPLEITTVPPITETESDQHILTTSTQAPLPIPPPDEAAEEIHNETQTHGTTIPPPIQMTTEIHHVEVTTASTTTNSHMVAEESQETVGRTEIAPIDEESKPETTITPMVILGMNFPTTHPISNSHSDELGSDPTIENVDANPLINTTETVNTRHPSLESESQEEGTAEEGITISAPASSEEAILRNSSRQKSSRAYPDDEPHRSNSGEFMIFGDMNPSPNSTTLSSSGETHQNHEVASYENLSGYVDEGSSEQQKTEQLVDGSREVIPVGSNDLRTDVEGDREIEEMTTPIVISLANDTLVNEMIENATQDVNSENIASASQEDSPESIVIESMSNQSEKEEETPRSSQLVPTTTAQPETLVPAEPIHEPDTDSNPRHRHPHPQGEEIESIVQEIHSEIPSSNTTISDGSSENGGSSSMSAGGEESELNELSPQH